MDARQQKCVNGCRLQYGGRLRKAGEKVFWQRVLHCGENYDPSDLLCEKCRAKVFTKCRKTGFQHVKISPNTVDASRRLNGSHSSTSISNLGRTTASTSNCCQSQEIREDGQGVDEAAKYQTAIIDFGTSNPGNNDSGESGELVLGEDIVIETDETNNVEDNYEECMPSSSNVLSTENSCSEIPVEVVYSQATSSAENPSQLGPRLKLDAINTVPSSESMCVICGDKTSAGRKIMSSTVAYKVWLNLSIFIPKRTRICQNHLEGDTLKTEAEDVLRRKAKPGALLTPNDICRLLSEMRSSLTEKRPALNFDDPSLPEENFKEMLGLTRENFFDLHKYVAPFINKSKHRTSTAALAIFLAKMRLGVSQKVLGILFNIPSQPLVSSIIHTVTKILGKYFVPKYLGYGKLHTDRNELSAKHNPQYVKQMFNVPEDNLVFILDGTYLYLQKSGDFHLQKRTYSLHKHRNLIKTMMVVTPDGYIVNADGPFMGDNGDGEILNQMLAQSIEAGILSLLQRGDHVLLDRGFRSAKRNLSDRGIGHSAPADKNKQEKALTTEQANKSRQVTMCRHPVETANGRPKNIFDFFDNVIPNPYIPIAHTMFQIACGIINKYHPPIFTESENHPILLEQVQLRLGMCNELMKKVKKFNLESFRKWERASESVLTEFPRLSLDDLWIITLGDYQVKNAKKYTDLHTRNNPLYEIFISKKEGFKNILRAKLESRFRRSLLHTLWIEYLPEDEIESETESSPSNNCRRRTAQYNFGSRSTPIVSYYCLCQVGSRVVGACSHVTAVLWYLGYARYQTTNKTPKRCLGSFLLDAAESTARGQTFEELVNAEEDEIDIVEEMDVE